MRPKADQPVIPRDDLESLPKLRAKPVFLLRLRERFAVELALFAFDVQSNGAQKITFIADEQLKFRQPPFQVEHLQPRPFPKLLQPIQIIHRRPAHGKFRRIHLSQCKGGRATGKDFGGKRPALRKTLAP